MRKSRLTISLLSTYIATLYSASSYFIVLPFLLEAFGVEQFGLISIFMLLQAWLNIVDAGFSGSVTRLIAESSNSYKNLSAAITIFNKILLLFIAISGAALLIFLQIRLFIVENWINSEINEHILSTSILYIVLVLIVKYLTGPIRGAMQGFERHTEISLILIVATTMKFPMATYLSIQYKLEIIEYFQFQFLVALVEFMLFATLFLRNKTLFLSELEHYTKNYDDVQDLEVPTFRKTLYLTFSLSLLSVLWVLNSQFDKLILSGIIPLSDFSLFSITVSLSSAMLLIASPLSQILGPRLTKLHTQGLVDDYRNLVKNSFAFVTCICGSFLFLLMFFGGEILLIWTNNNVLAETHATTLTLLGIGNLICLYMNICYLVLYSRGQLKIHAKVYTVFSLVLMPITYFIAHKYAVDGVTLLWISQNIVIFCLWGSVVLIKIFGFKFMLECLSAMSLCLGLIFLIVKLMHVFSPIFDSDFTSLAYLSICGLASFLVSTFSYWVIFINSSSKAKIL